tara:strand:+ start:1210 stop:1563 length:354 start_codon:yes stop_codon:yes gene_type:complete
MVLDRISRNWVSLTILSLTGITILSLWPLPYLPPVPGTDKTHHLIAYAILMFPAAFRRPRNWQALALTFMAYGGAIELLQPYVNRYGEWLDFAANTFGICIGITAAILIRGINRKAK